MPCCGHFVTVFCTFLIYVGDINQKRLTVTVDEHYAQNCRRRTSNRGKEVRRKTLKICCFFHSWPYSHRVLRFRGSRGSRFWPFLGPFFAIFVPRVLPRFAILGAFFLLFFQSCILRFAVRSGARGFPWCPSPYRVSPFLKSLIFWPKRALASGEALLDGPVFGDFPGPGLGQDRASASRFAFVLKKVRFLLSWESR